MRNRRYYNPRNEERKEREARQFARCEEDKAAYKELLKGHRLIPLTHDDALAAWKHAETRTFVMGYRSDGGQYAHILRTAENGVRFLQCAGFPSWDFFRLEAEDYIPTKDEQALMDRLSEKAKRGY